MTGPLRIGLVDDHAVVRSGYRRLIELEDDLAVTAEFVDAESTYAALTAPGPCPVDLLVLDLSLPGQSGLELLRHLAQRLPSLPILVFTMHESGALVQQCLRAGAAGFVTKCSEPGMLLDALRRIARGEIALSDDVGRRARRRPHRADAAPERQDGGELPDRDPPQAGRRQRGGAAALCAPARHRDAMNFPCPARSS
jgi:DNA-binding NarL/FixJ family response regulator